MHDLTIAQMISGLREKKFSSKELTQHYLNRINSSNAELNSFITVTDEFALKQAEHIDSLNAKNVMPSKIAGIPLAQKDIFCTKGIKTSCGSKMLDNFIAPYNATVIEKCNQAGLVLLGKTNMDEFAMGSSNENSFYGPCKNPWDTSMIPGGSSGGSAAAVAARLTPLATGTDTGGSIRQPAALCGVTGLKPTYGRVSRFGMIAFASSLDQGGPMARSAEDVAYLLNTIAGFDQKDSTSLEAEVPDYTQNLNQPIDNLKIGLPTEFFNQDLDPKINQALQDAKKQFENLGASFVEVSLPNMQYAVPVYYVVACAECSSNLSRFDGIRFGYSAENPKDLKDLYMRSRQQGFGEEVKRRILTGTYALSAGYYDAYYLQAQKVRQLIAQDFQNVFKQVDVILGPTSPTPAFKIGEKIDDPIQMYLSDIYTIAVNLAGLPGMSLPAGMVNNLPIGMQLIGNHLSESTLLNVAHRFQTTTDWHLKSPTKNV